MATQDGDDEEDGERGWKTRMVRDRCVMANDGGRSRWMELGA